MDTERAVTKTTYTGILPSNVGISEKKTIVDILQKSTISIM